MGSVSQSFIYTRYLLLDLLGPKVESALKFVKAGGEFSAIGDLSDLEAIVRSEKGTRIVNDCAEIQFYE